MSHLMFLGTLRAPVSEEDPVGLAQLSTRAKQAADRIESDAHTIEKLAAERDKLIEIASEAMGWNWISQAETDGIDGDPEGRLSVEPMQALVDNLEAVKHQRVAVSDDHLETGTLVPQEWVKAAEDFVEKCEGGKARSTKSYSAFKALLSQIPGNPHGKPKTFRTAEEAQ